MFLPSNLPTLDYAPYNILGIDPGNHLGIAILSISPLDSSIRSITTDTYHLGRYWDYYPTTQDFIPIQRYNKSLYVQQVITYLQNTYSPIAIAIEQPFINTKFPMAITTLTRLCTTLEYSILSNNPNALLVHLPPKIVKATFYDGTATKQDMLQSLQRIPELHSLIPSASSLTEHEVDAIAIAYTLLLEIRRTPNILLY